MINPRILQQNLESLARWLKHGHGLAPKHTPALLVEWIKKDKIKLREFGQKLVDGNQKYFNLKAKNKVV